MRRCLDADVPVGVFLSGGVDSSVVAALAARHHPGIAFVFRRVRGRDMERIGLCAKSGEPSRLAASRNHHPPPGCFKNPSQARLALWPTLWRCVSGSHVYDFQLARQHVKVCLSGDGGDESFAGYWRAQAGVYAARYGALVPEVAEKATWYRRCALYSARAGGVSPP